MNTIEYVADMARELAKLAAANGHPFLAQLLHIAAAEAQSIADAPPPSPTVG